MGLNVKYIIKQIHGLEVITNSKTLERDINFSDISRPGLELTGYFDYFPKQYVQILGRNEVTYLEKIEYDNNIINQLIVEEVPLIVFCRGLVPPKKFIKLANERNVPIFLSKRSTSRVLSEIFNLLDYELAPTTQIHGVLMSIYGQGVLIKGASGIGKSEVALELLNKGHFLVADDAVLIKKLDDEILIGSAPELLKNRLEIRGVGIIDVQKLYGVTRVIPTKKIVLVIELKTLDGNEERIGTITKSEDILSCNVPKIQIPITAGRSISNLIEVAVANFELKKYYNYDSAKCFVNDLNEMLRNKGEK